MARCCSRRCTEPLWRGPYLSYVRARPQNIDACAGVACTGLGLDENATIRDGSTRKSNHILVVIKAAANCCVEPFSQRVRAPKRSASLDQSMRRSFTTLPTAGFDGPNARNWSFLSGTHEVHRILRGCVWLGPRLRARVVDTPYAVTLLFGLHVLSAH